MPDREKLIELLKTIPQVNHAQAAVEGLDYVFGCAADHLISEGVTVRERGRWVDAYGIRKSKCTSCGVAFGRVMDADCYYCPNCGAKMDGERRTNEPEEPV